MAPVDDDRLRRLLETPPRLHASEGRPVSWGIQGSFLKFMAKVLTRESLSLETGCGLSTVCFAILGSEHFCISPLIEEHERVRAYCRENGISTDRIRFVPMRSQGYLPTIGLGGRRLDFALVDGSHAFPNPIIDYFFINENLRVGGLLAIDDLAIPSVGILHRFLTTEPAYKLIRLDSSKTGIYRKIAETHCPNDWPDQRFNRRYPDLSYLPVHLRLWTTLRSIPTPERHRVVQKIYNRVREWIPQGD